MLHYGNRRSVQFEAIPLDHTCGVTSLFYYTQAKNGNIHTFYMTLTSLHSGLSAGHPLNVVPHGSLVQWLVKAPLLTMNP